MTAKSNGGDGSDNNSDSDNSNRRDNSMMTIGKRKQDVIFGCGKGGKVTNVQWKTKRLYESKEDRLLLLFQFEPLRNKF